MEVETTTNSGNIKYRRRVHGIYSVTQEAVWLRLLLSDIGCAPVTATTIYEDNQGCIALTRNPVLYSRTKHIDIKFHFLRKKIEGNVIELKYKPTDKMIADGMTKALGRAKHVNFIRGLRLEPKCDMVFHVRIKGEC